MLLMNKLTAIRKGNNGQGKAILNFRNVWITFIDYWKQVRLQDDLSKEVLDILQNDMCIRMLNIWEIYGKNSKTLEAKLGNQLKWV